MDSRATSVMAWRLHRSAIAVCLVYFREIDPAAFWDFCNTIGTKRTFKVPRRRSDVEGRADMARTLPEGDLRYATDFLPRPDGAGCSPGGGGASSSWWPWPRLCQELRTPELAGVPGATRRRFEPRSSPSASSFLTKIASAPDGLKIAQ